MTCTYREETPHEEVCIAGLATIARLGVLQASAHAGTAKETFDKLIAKFAPDQASLQQNFKPKVGCGCVSNELPGFVVLDVAGHVNCGLPQFNPNGSLGGFLLQRRLRRAALSHPADDHGVARPAGGTPSPPIGSRRCLASSVQTGFSMTERWTRAFS